MQKLKDEKDRLEKDLLKGVLDLDPKKPEKP